MNKLISGESESKDLLVTLSGPFCCGKSTTLKHLINNYNFKHLTNTTTRPKRPGEINGVDYNFVNGESTESLGLDEFSEKLYCGKFIVASEFKDNFYGVPNIQTIDGLLCTDILSDYVKFLKKRFGEKLLSIFVSPPRDEQELIRRARVRGDSDKDIEERLRLGKLERPEHCDIVIPDLHISLVINEVLKAITKKLCLS